MKKFLKLCIMIFAFLLITGCGNNYNSSPESVAEEMVKRLIKKDYDDMEELLKLEQGSFIDEKSFENYLNENNINIPTNEDYEIVKDNEVNGNSKTVIVKFKNSTLKINTVKENDKWYIELGEYNYDEDLIIKVPKGSIVKINDVKLDFEKYGKSEEENRHTRHGKDYYYDVVFDVYTISQLFEGEYILNVEHENIKNINHKIHSDKSEYDWSLKEEDDIFSDKSDCYVLIPPVSDDIYDGVKNYISTYFNDLFASANEEKTFETLNAYFNNIKDSDKNAFETEYNNLVKDRKQGNSYSEKFYTDFSLNNISFYEDEGIYYQDENTIIAMVSYTMKYRYVFNYIGFMSSMNDTFHEDKYETKTYKGVIHLSKDKDTFKLLGGVNIIPNI